MPLARHQVAALTLAPPPHAGYVLGGVAYALAPAWARQVEAVAQAHAGVLGLRKLHSKQTPELEAQAMQAARVYAAQEALLAGNLLSAGERQALRSHFANWPANASPTEAARTGTLHIATDGSRQKAGSGGLGLGYTLGQNTLNRRPYSFALPPDHAAAQEFLAERLAILLALRHAEAIVETVAEANNPPTLHVYSDHMFHVRRYREGLAHPTSQKTPSLEALDALVSRLGPRITFHYAPTADTDAPHRLALHAQALQALALSVPQVPPKLTGGQASALRRVHFALKALARGELGVLF